MGRRWVAQGMASVTLLTLAARRNPDVDRLREQGLLTHDEEAWLEEDLLKTSPADRKLFQRAMVMWAWNLRLATVAFRIAKVPAYVRMGTVR